MARHGRTRLLTSRGIAGPNRACGLPGRADRLPSTYPRNQLDEEGAGKPTTMRVILSWHSLCRRAIPFCGRAGLYG
jgi:hypothetical protein